jgi:iron complex transport system substrate-binding protein
LLVVLQLPKKRVVVWAVLSLFGSGFAASTASGQAPPQRVVSLNLCTDQLLLALADRVQIHSLSPLVRDHTISFLAREAAALPVNGGRGETIVFSGADLVLAGPDSHLKRELLEGQGLSVVVLEPWRSLDDGRAQIRLVSRVLGHPDRGERLIAEIDAALARTASLVPGPRSILTYYRRGWVPPSDSPVSEILRHMGFTLHQDAIGLGRGGVARLENVVAVPPDYVLMDEVAGQTVDNGSALLIHPALIAAVPAERRLVIADRLAICGGPSTPATIDALAAQVRSIVR